MNKRAIITLFLAILTFAVYAQKKKQAKQNAVIVVGKVLSQKDSLQVRELYFDGLHEKIVMNYPRALTFFNRVLEIDPSNDAALYELANINFAENKEAEAEQLIRNAVTVNPDNEWYWSLMADIYKKTNKLPELLNVLNELIRIVPGREEYYYDKANALLMQKKVKEAAIAYDEIEKQFGSSADLNTARQQILMQQGKPEKVEAELEKQILEKPDELRNYMYLNEVFSKSGQREKAVAVLNRAKAKFPENALIRLALADHYRALNQFDNTFIELKVAFADPNLNIDEKVRIVLSFFPMFSDMKARAYADELASIMVRIHPDEAKAFAVFGDVLFQERKYPEAQDAYRKALKLNDQIYQIWEQLLHIGISRGDYSQVITEGEQALAIFPNQVELYLYTGIAFSQTQKHEKAIAYLKNASDLGSEDKEILGQVYSTLGDSYNALKNYRESDQFYDKALELNPANSYVLNNYAYYLSLRGENLDKAGNMSKRSIELDPNNASSEDTYAWILFRLKKYKDARLWIEKALKSDSTNNATQVEHYGDILYLLGEKEQALEQWQKAKTLSPGSEKLNKKINEKKYIE